jgi:tetratricopeptide (TPR) repeat protein
MTGKSKDRAAKVNVLLLAGVFLIFALLFFSGCTEQQTVSGDVENLKIKPVEKTEDELLAELHFKFENPNAHYQLGSIYHKQGRWAKAEYHYNLALSFDPSHRPAQAALVKMLADSGDTTKAEQFAKAYMNQVAVSAKQSLKLARAFEQEQLYEYSLTCYEQALRLGPNLPEVSKYFGYYYLNRGDKARAKEFLTRSFKLNPNQPDVAGALGQLGVAVEVPRRPVKQEKRSAGPT